jgi:hypothetical protein
MIRPSGTAHQRKTINQTQFLLFESYVIRVVVAGENAAPDIFNRPDPVPAFAI